MFWLLLTFLTIASFSHFFFNDTATTEIYTLSLHDALPIRGYAELTRRGRDEVPPDIAHALRRVESESARMTALVEDLLLLARLDSGRPLEAVEVDLSRLVADVVSDAHVAGPDHHYRLVLPDEPVTVT